MRLAEISVVSYGMGECKYFSLLVIILCIIPSSLELS